MVPFVLSVKDSAVAGLVFTNDFPGEWEFPSLVLQENTRVLRQNGG